MNKALTELIKISKSVGKDNSLVQGGGGNTSTKTRNGKYMYIKASGTALKELSEHRGWRRLKLGSVLAILKDKSVNRLKREKKEKEIVDRLNLCLDDNIKTVSRPSVESHMHAILDRCVVHLHPLVVGAYVCAKNGRTELEKLFRDEKFSTLWIPYVDPGYTLAIKIRGLVDNYKTRYGRNPEVIFLEKHGLLVSASTANRALALVQRVIKVCSNKLKGQKAVQIKSVKQDDISSAKLIIRRVFFETMGDYIEVKHFIDSDITKFLARRDAKRIASPPALTPDELVYANGPAMWLDKCDYKTILDKLNLSISRGQKPPVSFLVKRLGLFVAGIEKNIPAIKDVVTASLLIRSLATNFGGGNPLNSSQRQFINQWEAESFRQKLTGGTSRDEFKGRIAVVTGAGSGLCRSIAIGLAQAGVCVALVDIDKKSVQETEAIIKKGVPDASTITIRCDVTREKDVDNTFASILEQWGGVDILVNAAGIAPASPLVDLPALKWRQSLEVNLTGYFLMARAVSRIMIKQRIGGNIINISSKSGLEASRDNTPYNATKAAEIHMARGWALELGKYGIRVNSIAPGNIFESSKIWNSKYIKVCAKKYGIRPEQVIPYYINMTALKCEIKGEDIANAVVFLSSKKARTITGQTLVVDSGQVMVR